MKFRKRPVVIEAVQFTGDNVTEIQIHTGLTRFRLIDPDEPAAPGVAAVVYDELHSTWVGVLVGNWIIRGVQGEVYPCDAAVFEATYERVDAP